MTLNWFELRSIVFSNLPFRSYNKYSQEDAFFHENKPEYPVEIQMVSKLPTHEIISVVESSQDIGHPDL